MTRLDCHKNDNGGKANDIVSVCYPTKNVISGGTQTLINEQLHLIRERSKTESKKWYTVPTIPLSSSAIAPQGSTPSNPTVQNSSSAAPMGPSASTLQNLPPPDLHRPITTPNPSSSVKNRTHLREPLQASLRSLY